MKTVVVYLSLLFAIPVFAAELSYKAVWEGIKDDGKAPQEIEVGKRWNLSKGEHHGDEILKKFGESTLVGSAYTFVVEKEGDGGLVVYWVRASSKQEANGSFVTTMNPGSSKLQKGETRVPVGGDLSVTISVK